MKRPKMPKSTTQEKITPFPDMGGVNANQARWDAMKALLSRRGRSSTLLTWGKKPPGGGAVALSGRLSDIEGGRERATVERGP